MKILDDLTIEQAKLDTIDDQLYAAITSIESALRDRISILIEIDVEGASFQSIAFGKKDSEWCLQVVLSGTRHKLLSASRSIRAEAFAGGHIARLINESAAVIRAQVASREAATKAAANVLAMLEANGDKK